MKKIAITLAMLIMIANLTPIQSIAKEKTENFGTLIFTGIMEEGIEYKVYETYTEFINPNIRAVVSTYVERTVVYTPVNMIPPEQISWKERLPGFYTDSVGTLNLGEFMRDYRESRVVAHYSGYIIGSI